MGTQGMNWSMLCCDTCSMHYPFISTEILYILQGIYIIVVWRPLNLHWNREQARNLERKFSGSLKYDRYKNLADFQKISESEVTGKRVAGWIWRIFGKSAIFLLVIIFTRYNITRHNYTRHTLTYYYTTLATNVSISRNLHIRIILRLQLFLLGKIERGIV